MGCAAKDTASCSLAAHDFSANSVFGGYPDRVGVISVLKGNMYLKTALVEAANAAAKAKGTYLRDKFYCLKARRGYKRAAVAAHKILVATYRGGKLGWNENSNDRTNPRPKNFLAANSFIPSSFSPASSFSAHDAIEGEMQSGLNIGTPLARCVPFARQVGYGNWLLHLFARYVPASWSSGRSPSA
jgi:hypothetical protein